MQTRLLIGIFSIFTCIILYVLVWNYVKAMSSYILPSISSYQLTSAEDNASIGSAGWIDQLSKREQSSFIYPAAELKVKLLFEDSLNRVEKETFRVSVGVIDDYQFFCINQVLSANNIEYSYYKIGENIWLVVTTENKGYLRSVLDELKHYDINYTLSKS